MTQTSGPLTDQTFTDEEWRETVGDEPGVKGDVNGSSYGITLAINSDVALIGSASQDSIAVVGGFRHKIPAGAPEGVTIAAIPSGPTRKSRTDLIVLRYDPTWGAAAPGPVRLTVIPGTEGSGVPTYDSTPPGVEDFPLWEVTRSPGGALSQATTRRRAVRTGPNLYVQLSSLSDLPTGVPLGSRVRLGSGGNAREFVRALDDQANAVWEPQYPARVRYQVTGGTGSGIVSQNITGYSVPNLFYPFRALVFATLRVTVNGTADFVATLRASGVDYDQDELRGTGGIAHLQAVYESATGAGVDFGLFLDRQAGTGTASVVGTTSVNRIDIVIEPL